MSTLTIALASLGGVVLAGVVAHGAWQARKAGPKRAVMEPRPEPRDPVMGDPTVAVQADAHDLAELSPGSERRPNKRIVNRLDALIDSIATLAVEAPVSGAVAIAHLPGTRRAGGKPFLIEGLNSETGEWEAPASAHRYGEFQAGVLLANRTGALNEIEYSEFVQKVQAFAEGIGAFAQFPDMLEAVAAARELDGFAGQRSEEHTSELQSR